MNWSRKEIKDRSKRSLRYNYWKAFFVSLLLLVFSGGITLKIVMNTIEEIPDYINSAVNSFKNGVAVNPRVFIVLLILALGMIFLYSLVNILVDIFLKNPVGVGAARFMVKTAKATRAEEEGMIADVTFAFDHEYVNIVKVLFLRTLFIFLWSLLLVIPGIYKTYQYRMIPYILGDNPEIESAQAFKISREMMKGNIWKVFIFDLSFIPWHLLGIITLGLGELFYVQPFYNIASANLYMEIKEIYYLKKEMEEYKNELHNFDS